MGTMRGALGATFCLALACGPANAGRPLATEDAGILESGACEAEGSLSHASSPRAPRMVAAQVGCGAGWGTQIALGVGRTTDAGGITGSVNLLGKTALATLADEGELAIAYAAQWARPSGAGLRRTSSEIKAVLTVPVQKWLVHVNLGRRQDAEAGSALTYGLALERLAAIGALDIMGEIHGASGARPVLQSGVRWTVGAGLFIDASLARQLGRGGPRTINVGFKHAF